MCVKNSCLNFLKHQEYEWSYAETIRRKLLSMKQNQIVYILDELYRMLYDTLNNSRKTIAQFFTKVSSKVKHMQEIAEEMNLSVKSINRYKQKTMELFTEMN